MNRLLRTIAGMAGLLALSGCIGLDFSPDGKWLVVSTAHGMAIIPVEGGAPKLIPGADDGSWAQWAPDGKTILFLKQDSKTGSDDLQAYDVGTKQLRKIGP